VYPRNGVDPFDPFALANEHPFMAGGVRQRLIILGEGDSEVLPGVVTSLRAAGYENLLVAGDLQSIVDHLRAHQRMLEEIGLIIVNKALSDGRLEELCRMVADYDNGIGVPMIVGVDESFDSHSPDARQLAELGLHGVSLVQWPPQNTELLSVVNLSLLFRYERHLRRAQEDQLLSELSERKIMEAQLKYLVAHDELTGLANRRSLEKKLLLALHRCKNFKQEGALLYLDLDRFNLINDLEGHDFGDRLLVEVVGVLHAAVEREHIAARIGADEFCLFIENISEADALALAERIRQALDGFHVASGRDNYQISASIGVAMLEPAATPSHPGELITRAHQACYMAKSFGRNRVHLYDEKDIDVYTRQKDIQWVPLIRDALAANRFFMVFQPVVRVGDGAITHYEVLVRMRGKYAEEFGPGEFIPVAERMGLIHQIDLWMIENAINFLAALPESQSDVCLTVNLSGHSFQGNDLYSLIRQKLEWTWVSPSRLTFEITETATVANHHQTREMIARIRGLGCRFALDDFGAGFSSFDYIKKFPVDYLKIDGQFILNLLDDETDRVLVKAMIDIARKLGKRTIAEFVENPEVLNLLTQLGVDYVQGYLIGRPSPQLLPRQYLPLQELIAPVPDHVAMPAL
jgi:diguanylate cyclase (GGDEF)-like protein